MDKQIAYVKYLPPGDGQGHGFYMICTPEGELINSIGVSTLEHWEIIMSKWMPGVKVCEWSAGRVN